MNSPWKLEGTKVGKIPSCFYIGTYLPACLPGVYLTGPIGGLIKKSRFRIPHEESVNKLQTTHTLSESRSGSGGQDLRVGSGSRITGHGLRNPVVNY